MLIRYPNHYDSLTKWMASRSPSIERLEVDIQASVVMGSREATLLVSSLIEAAKNSTCLDFLYITGGNRLDMDCGTWLPHLKRLRGLYLEEREPDQHHFFPSWFLHMNHLTKLTSLEVHGDDYSLPYEGSLEYYMLPDALCMMPHLQTLKLVNLGICAFSEEAFTDHIIKAASSLHELR